MIGGFVAAITVSRASIEGFDVELINKKFRRICAIFGAKSDC